jgi:hypothetical protein
MNKDEITVSRKKSFCQGKNESLNQRKTHASQRVHGIMILTDLGKSGHHPCRCRELSGR